MHEERPGRNAVVGGVQGGAGLIKKVRFPHEHLVFSVIVAQFVTLMIELGLLTVVMLAFGNNVLPWLLPLMLVLLMLAAFSSGVALVLSAANVFYHDVNYLWGILSQILVERTGGGLVAAQEILIANDAVRALIRERKTPQLYNVLQTGGREGMRTLESSLNEYVASGIVTHETAARNANLPDQILRR